MSEPKIPDYVALYEVIARLRSGVYTDTAVDNYLGLTGIMAQAGLAEITSETLTLTAAGRDMAVKIEAHAGKRS